MEVHAEAASDENEEMVVMVREGRGAVGLRYRHSSYCHGAAMRGPVICDKR